VLTHCLSGSVFSKTAKEVQDFRGGVNVQMHEFSKYFVQMHESASDLALQSYSVRRRFRKDFVNKSAAS
jgi:hypothetical protein